MFQQTPYAQYGNKRSYYGNIQLGSAPKFIQNYGAWPTWNEPLREIEEEAVEIIKSLSVSYIEEIDSRIGIIKRLKESIQAENDNLQKNILREQMRIERLAKERAFRLKARIDEDEATFILLN